jgi:hypothetical protein
MSEHEQMYPAATGELAEERKRLAPDRPRPSRRSVGACSPTGRSP